MVGQINQFVGIEHIKSAQATLIADQLRTNTANAFYPGTTVDEIVKWTGTVRIGFEAVVMVGVTIGDGAIIASRAVVTKMFLLIPL